MYLDSTFKCSYFAYCRSIDQHRFSSDIHVDDIAAQATRMVDFLTEENKALRLKLAMYDHKVTKLQKVNIESFIKSSVN